MKVISNKIITNASGRWMPQEHTASPLRLTASIPARRLSQLTFNLDDRYYIFELDENEAINLMHDLRITLQSFTSKRVSL